MEVALEPAALGVARLDDPRARGAEVVELGEHLGAEPLVLEREPDGRAELPLELRARRRVRDDGDAPAVADERRQPSARRRRGLVDRPAKRVAVPPRGRKPVRDPEGRIAERLGERGFDRAGRRRLAEVGDDPGDRATLDASADERPAEPGGERDHGRAAEREDRRGTSRRGDPRAGVRSSATPYAIVGACEQDPGHEDGPERRAAGPGRRHEPRSAERGQRGSLQRRGTTGPTAATSCARLGAAWTRKTLSVKLLQRVGVEERVSEERAEERRRVPPRCRPRRREPAPAREATRPVGNASTRWTSSGNANPAATMPRLRTSGGPPSQPTQNGANQTTPAASARSPRRRVAGETTPRALPRRARGLRRPRARRRAARPRRRSCTARSRGRRRARRARSRPRPPRRRGGGSGPERGGTPPRDCGTWHQRRIRAGHGPSLASARMRAGPAGPSLAVDLRGEGVRR